MSQEFAIKYISSADLLSCVVNGMTSFFIVANCFHILHKSSHNLEQPTCMSCIYLSVLTQANENIVGLDNALNVLIGS